VKSIDEAIDWSTKFAGVLGDLEVDVRPVTEAWDLGFSERPADLTTTRYMATHKHPGGDGCVTLNEKQAAQMGELMAQMQREGVLLSAVGLAPSAKGACLRLANGKSVVLDGPFAESKELLGGFVIVRADSLAEAVGWATRYQEVVGAEEVEVRQVIEHP
jgi:hypothetical protein